jgi:DNA-binding CsgD family transcriptional regulator
MLHGTSVSYALQIRKRPSKELRKKPDELQKLDHRQRVVLSLFSGKERLTSLEIAATLGLSVRMARVIIKNGWMTAG